MTWQQGLALGIVMIIGYVGWLLTAIALYRNRSKKRELEEKVTTLEKR